MTSLASKPCRSEVDHSSRLPSTSSIVSNENPRCRRKACALVLRSRGSSACQRASRDDCDLSRSLTDLGLDLPRDVGVLAQELLRILASLPDSLFAIGEPRATLVQHPGGDAHVDQTALARDALGAEDLDLDGLER